MIAKLYQGKNESGDYYQGLMLITQGRLKGIWKEVTLRYYTEAEAQQELDDFKASALAFNA